MKKRRKLYFENEYVEEDDLVYLCSVIEAISRNRKIHKIDTVNQLGFDGLYHIISCADTYHCLNLDDAARELIDRFGIKTGCFDITNVDDTLYEVTIPLEVEMGVVYSNLIIDTLGEDETYLDGLFRFYNNLVCKVVDTYDNGAYYEPPNVIAKAFEDGWF